jgi:FtsZ-interacting cell division protein ZipA
MSTVAIIVIAIAVLALIAIVVAMSRRARAKREIGHAQVEAQHDDVDHHRERAEQRRNEAALSEEIARRASAEAELNERQASERAQELENRD